MADRRLLWKAVGSLSGVAAGSATRALLRAAWRRTRGGDPPTNPASPTTQWSEALIWAMASGVALAVTRLVAQRGAAEAWKATTGSYPAGLESVSP
jgi:hypothetical protein